jgi:hypothetical protein
MRATRQSSRRRPAAENQSKKKPHSEQEEKGIEEEGTDDAASGEVKGRGDSVHKVQVEPLSNLASDVDEEHYPPKTDSEAVKNTPGDAECNHVEGDHDDVDDDTSTSSSPPSKYEVGERVWVRERKWGGVYYEATIRRAALWGPRRKMLTPGEVLIQSEVDDEPELCWHYFVHHIGWNTKWDAFAEERDIFPDTPEVRITAKKTQQQMKKKNKSAADLRAIEAQKKLEEKQIKEEEAAATSAAEKKKGRQLAKELTLKEHNLCGERGNVQNANRLPIPQPLISHLVAEWEIISPHSQSEVITRRLHNLPATVSVKDALDSYLKSKIDLCKGDDEEEKRAQWVEMCEGVECFFNQMLRGLLYPEEMCQLEELDKMEDIANKEKSEVYGCFHLLRMASKLPTMLAGMPQNEISSITGKMADLVRFLHKNEKNFFHASYREPTQNELNPDERSRAKARSAPKRKRSSVSS